MKKKIQDNIYYLGVNDRQKPLFENLWAIPHGVAYNSYLLLDEKNVLMDTVEICYSDAFLKSLENLLEGKSLDYLIINHMEPDHAGSIRLLRQRYPEVQLVGNKKTFDMLKGFHGIEDGLYEVKEGDTLCTGEHTYTFYMAPMVHWPEVMFTYENSNRILFSADAFGTFGTLDGGIIDSNIDTTPYWEEMKRYYACIVGKYGSPVQKALKKLSSIEVDKVCSTHGPIWTKQGELDKVISLYDKLSKYEGEEGVVIAYGSMYGHTEEMAETIASALSDAGVKNIVLHNLSKSDKSYILKDIFKYNGLILGAPTYCNSIYPEMETLMSMIQLRDIKNRHFSCFGNFTWAGTATKKLIAFAETMKWEMIGTPVDQKQGASKVTEGACIAMAQAMAEKIKNSTN